MPSDALPLALDQVQDSDHRVALGSRAVLLRGLARSRAPELLAAIGAIDAVSPFRHLVTPGGWKMSVALTNCGRVGWVTDRTGYRYTATLLHGYANPLKRLNISESVNPHKCLILLDSCRIHATRCQNLAHPFGRY